VQFALAGVFRGAGTMVASMMITILSQWILQLPLAYFLAHHTSLGTEGLWWSMPIANVLTALATIGLFAKGDWRKKKLLSDEERLTEKVSEEILEDVERQ